MIWAKRRFSPSSHNGDYGTYMERLAHLHRRMPSSPEFMMVARNVGLLGDDDIYVGLPIKALLAAFDGFEIVSERDVPREIDFLLYTEHTSGEFERHFFIRNYRERLRARREEQRRRN